MYEVGVVDRRSDAGSDSESTSPMPFEVDKLLCHPDRVTIVPREISSSPSSESDIAVRVAKPPSTGSIAILAGRRL